MFSLLRHLLAWMVSAVGSRQDFVLENLALRQQLLALNAKRPRRRLSAGHKLFWILLRRLWSGWKAPLILVTPRTVVEWHRAVRMYWKWISRTKRIGGRKPVSKEVRALIFRMVAENPTWGAPRIHGELLKLGFAISEPTVSRWLQRAPRNPEVSKRWLTFLHNREAIAAMDFFTVPITFGVLYCLFVIDHNRRSILRCNVTRNPSALWIVQQRREAWPYTSTPKFLLFDHDAKFGLDVVSTVQELGSKPLRTAYRRLWQNRNWVALGQQQLEAGIGINTGTVNVGNMGSAKRFAWTVMGDNVNLASRLEGATKEYRVNILVGEGTYQAAEQGLVFRELDFIRVKGKHLPVRIYELMDTVDNEERHAERIELWSRGLKLYRSADWEVAVSAFENVLKKYPADGPASVFLERSEEKMRETAVTSWDGVWVMKTK